MVDVEVTHPTKCPSCEGTGKVYYQADIDDDNYPLYKRMVSTATVPVLLIYVSCL